MFVSDRIAKVKPDLQDSSAYVLMGTCLPLITGSGFIVVKETNAKIIIKCG